MPSSLVAARPPGTDVFPGCRAEDIVRQLAPAFEPADHGPPVAARFEKVREVVEHRGTEPFAERARIGPEERPAEERRYRESCPWVHVGQASRGTSFFARTASASFVSRAASASSAFRPSGVSV
jgi:hypothetical protein